MNPNVDFGSNDGLKKVKITEVGILFVFWVIKLQ